MSQESCSRTPWIKSGLEGKETGQWPGGGWATNPCPTLSPPLGAGGETLKLSAPSVPCSSLCRTNGSSQEASWRRARLTLYWEIEDLDWTLPTLSLYVPAAATEAALTHVTPLRTSTWGAENTTPPGPLLLWTSSDWTSSSLEFKITHERHKSFYSSSHILVSHYSTLPQHWEIIAMTLWEGKDFRTLLGFKKPTSGLFSCSNSDI